MTDGRRLPTQTSEGPSSAGGVPPPERPDCYLDFDRQPHEGEGSG